MGVSAKSLFRLQELNRLGFLKPGDSVIELGAQELYCSGMEQSVADFLNFFSPALSLTASDEFVKRISNRGFTSELLKRAGFLYKALDIFDGDDVVLFDLNLESPGEELAGSFDLVTNFGTTEHVINQCNSFKTIHELTRPGGIIYHDLPLGGYHMHGYFNYNPLFFKHLANANDYEIIFDWYSRSGVPTDAPAFMRDNGFGAQWIDMGIEFVFRKTTDKPFQMPLETGTSLALNPKVWKGADPYGKGISMPAPDGNDHRNQLTEASQARKSNIALRLQDLSGWDLQNELFNRYKRRLLNLMRL